MVLRAVLALVAIAATARAAEETATSDSAQGARQLAASVTIFRDAWGVPHIDGPTDEAVIFGFAYAQAEDYFWQIEDSYVKGLGRYAELYGSSGVRSDTINRAFQVPTRAPVDYAKLEPEVRSTCEAFVAGLNYYLQTHADVRPRLLTRFEPWHLLAVGRMVTIEMGWGNTGAPRDQVPTEYGKLLESQGSNAWAISPAKTRSGKTMLFCNPHQPYFGYGQFYEGHLRSGEGWNFTGATFFGSPLPTIGHNEHVGWSFTVNSPGIGSAWRVTFDDPANPLNYRYGEGYRTAQQWTDTIRVKTRDGFEDRSVTFRRTHHGPIVKQLSNTEFLAANIGKFDESFWSRQNLKMVRARNLDEFKDAMAMLDFHIFNTVYADRHGNIFYLYNGIVPMRDPQLDWGHPVDGSDPRADWQGIHTLDELPQVANPRSEYVQSCNQSPFTTTDDGGPYLNDFPAYMVRERHDDKRRAKVSRMLLREMDDVTFDAWQEKAFDTTVYWALTELPKYARDFGELERADPALAASVRPYWEHLRQWDCIGSVSSTETTLCVAWYNELYGDVYRSETMQPQFVADRPARFKALAAAAERLKKDYGDWKIRYGDIHRMQRHANVADLFAIPFSDKAPSLPSAGLNGPLGVVFNMYFTPRIESAIFKTQKKHYAVVGHSYVAAIEFGERIQGGSLLQFGASGDARSPHFFDQAELMSQRRFKPQLFYWDDVVAGAKRVYHPGEGAVSAAAGGQ